MNILLTELSLVYIDGLSSDGLLCLDRSFSNENKDYLDTKSKEYKPP